MHLRMPSSGERLVFIGEEVGGLLDDACMCMLHACNFARWRFPTLKTRCLEKKAEILPVSLYFQPGRRIEVRKSVSANKTTVACQMSG